MAVVETFLEVRSIGAGDPSSLECRPVNADGSSNEDFRWIPLDKSVAREGLAVALTAVSAGKRLTARIVTDGDASTLATVRVVA